MFWIILSSVCELFWDRHRSSLISDFSVVRMIRPLLMCFVLCVVYGSSKPTEKKNRIHHEEPLSHLEHDDAKNYDYDHEAFLGQDEAKTFDSLPPEESRRRLGWVQVQVHLCVNQCFLKYLRERRWRMNFSCKRVHFCPLCRQTGNIQSWYFQDPAEGSSTGSTSSH